MYTLYLLINIVYHSSHVNKYEANKKLKNTSPDKGYAIGSCGFNIWSNITGHYEIACIIFIKNETKRLVIEVT